MRARAMAARTWGRAVPPMCLREAREPSTVRTPEDVLTEALDGAGHVGHGGAQLVEGDQRQVAPLTSAARTASATASWASRKGRPFLTR
jgi:hypothetical protein